MQWNMVCWGLLTFSPTIIANVETNTRIETIDIKTLEREKLDDIGKLSTQFRVSFNLWFSSRW